VLLSPGPFRTPHPPARRRRRRRRVRWHHIAIVLSALLALAMLAMVVLTELYCDAGPPRPDGDVRTEYETRCHFPGRGAR
jgi:hypothetical protein